MAKQCAICGVQMNVFQSQQLSDGNYICRKTCKKPGLNYLEYRQSDLEQVIAHNAQVERGTKLWEHFFIPRKKAADITNKLKNFHPIYIAEDIGLIALVETRFKYLFFGKSEHVCVFRIADLFMYDLERDTKVTNNKTKTIYYIRFYFRNVDGLFYFRKQFSQSTCKKIIRYFDELLGLPPTPDNFFDRLQNQIDMFTTFSETIKAVMSGAEFGYNKEHIEESLNKSGKLKFGDRTMWIEKADAVLKDF